jgi:hypothetical protein
MGRGAGGIVAGCDHDAILMTLNRRIRESAKAIRDDRVSGKQGLVYAGVDFVKAIDATMFIGLSEWRCLVDAIAIFPAKQFMRATDSTI